MELTSTEPLDYLHDAVVLSLAWEPLREDGRVLRLDAQCDADAGHPDWNGRKVSVRLLDVVLANHFVFGAVAGPELIDAWTDVLSTSVADSIDGFPLSFGTDTALR